MNRRRFLGMTLLAPVVVKLAPVLPEIPSPPFGWMAEQYKYQYEFKNGPPIDYFIGFDFGFDDKTVVEVFRV